LTVALAEPHKFRILLIEDNPGDVDLLQHALAGADVRYELTVIEDGAEALAFVRRQPPYAHNPVPDLAIIDLNIPKNHGSEVVEAMRMNRAFDDVPVVVLTTSSSPRERAQVTKLGISQYVTKPSDLEEFMRIGQTVRQLLDGRARRAGLE
jgi:two-component system response regulator